MPRADARLIGLWRAMDMAAVIENTIECARNVACSVYHGSTGLERMDDHRETPC